MVGRAELLSALFYLLAILVWTSPKAEEISIQNGNRTQLLLKNKRKWLAVPLILIGFVCKEQSLLAIVYLCLFELNRVKWSKTNKSNGTSPEGHHIGSSLDHRPMMRTSLSTFRRSNSLPGRLVTICLLSGCLLTAIYVRLWLMQFSMPIFNRYVSNGAKPNGQIK